MLGRQAGAVTAVLAGVTGGPLQRRPCIVDSGGELVLGRQPVVDGDDDRGRRVGECAAELVVALQVADHPAAAVEVDQRRLRTIIGCALAAVEPQLDRPGRARRLQR